MAISLVSKMFGSGLPAGPGLQVDRRLSSNAANVYVPPPPPRSGKGYYPPPPPPPFFGTWKNPIGMGVKKKVQRKRNSSRKKQPIQQYSSSGNNFVVSKLVIKPLSNFDLMDWIAELKIKHFRGIYSRDARIRSEKNVE